MEKKKLIKITCDKDCAEAYEQTSMSFAFVSSPDTGRKQCSSLHTCRENINGVLHSYKPQTLTAVNPMDNIQTAVNHCGNERIKLVDFEKLRLLIVKSVKEDYNDFKAKLFSGKALLNRYEEMVGWNPSKITTVKHPHHKNAWLLTGPKEWMSQPQLLSVVTLFMRLMSVHGPLKVDTFQQAEDSLRTLYNNYIKEKKSNKSNFVYYPDIEHYLVYLDDIHLLVSGAKKIFKDVNLYGDAWTRTNQNSSFGSQSGLLSFFGEDTTVNYNEYVEVSKRAFMALKNNGEL